jgi:hypothetical protein
VAAAYVEAEPARDLLPPWASSEYGFGALGTEAVSEETASIAVPCQVCLFLCLHNLKKISEFTQQAVDYESTNQRSIENSQTLEI